MNKRNIIYIVITAICVISVITAIFYQVSKSNKGKNNSSTQNTITDGQANQTLDLEALKEEFNNIFDNSFDDQGYDTTAIKKISGLEDKELVYSAYTIKDQKDGKYDIELNLPVFNVDGEVASSLNAITQSVFANKANDILTNTNVYTIYKIDYKAYLNDNILSLIIKSTLKEGNNAERLIVQTYNYDVTTGKIVTLNDVLQNSNIQLKDVDAKIEKVVTEANKQAEAVSSAVGQNIYKRDINNAMYVTDNVGYFFIGEYDQIYILYPYGNSNFTSEIDIVKV